MNRMTPLVKGLITGVLMVAATLGLMYSKTPGSSPVQYVVYVLYAGGIVWTLLAYSRSADYAERFGPIFGQGFRCFIVVTLVMVTFVGIYSSTHPEMAEEAAKLYKEDLIKDHNKTPAEIDELVNSAKKQFVTGTVSITIFGTLITGAIFTAAGAGLLLMRRK